MEKDEAVAQVLDRVRTRMRDQSVWSTWPGGWPGEIGTSLIDAVFSARAVYLSKHGRGIQPLVAAWSVNGGKATASLSALSDEIGTMGPTEWATKFNNSQHSPSRPSNAPGGPTKAATVLEAARLLLAGKPAVDTSQDITADNADNVRKTLLSVPGIGYATANYFLMLLGRPGVKPDRMVHRFIRDATGRGWTNSAAEEIVSRVADELQVAPHELDHAIWKYESHTARG